MRWFVLALLALLTACGQIGEEPSDSVVIDDTGSTDTDPGEICDNGQDDDGDGDVDCDDSDCAGDEACN